MPVIDFLQNEDGDMAVVNGDFALSGGSTDAANLQATQQAIAIALRMFLGECYLDQSVGVDWLGTILVKNPNPSDVTAMLTSTIAACPGVTSVISAGLTPGPDRTWSIDYTVITAYSSEPVSGTVTS